MLLIQIETPMQIQQDREFAKNYAIFNLICVLAILAAFLGSCWLFMISQYLGVAGLVLAAVGFVAYIAAERSKLRYYQCKKCGLELERKEDPDDRQFFYDCVDCDVRWKVGVSRPR